MAADTPRVDQQQVRRRIEANEERLSPYAARSAESHRRVLEPPSPLRGAFQRDRDRILHTKAFRRLTHKTQVFIAPLEDHYVTRMTHTLEVAQVARTITRALNLNEDLSEAAALGHDIGHGPFGHAGEEALAECLPEGFRHNYQSVRVLDQLEGGGSGLNLTIEVLDAIAKSSKAREDIFAEGWGKPDTLEGEVVKTADAIAYVNHDILDAIRAGLLSEADLPSSTVRDLGSSHAERLNTLISDIVESSWACTGETDGRTTPGIKFSPTIHAAANELREFMFERVYLNESIRAEAQRGKGVVVFLFRHFVSHPELISPDYSRPDDVVERRAADYVSGMTDRYAIRLARDLGCPDASAWRM